MTIEEFKKVKIEAMKNHDKDGVSALNTLINKLMLESIEKKSKGEEMNDADFVRILQKTVSELNEEKESFVKAGREETVQSLNNQLSMIEKFLPKLMSKEEIKAEILKLSDRAIPVVMKHFKENFAGKVNMKDVSEVLKTL